MREIIFVITLQICIVWFVFGSININKIESYNKEHIIIEERKVEIK